METRKKNEKIKRLQDDCDLLRREKNDLAIHQQASENQGEIETLKACVERHRTKIASQEALLE